jgi:chromosome partitioning protein
MQELYLDHGLSLYSALLGKDGVKLDTLIHKHATEPYWVVPSGYEMMLAEQGLFMARNREHKLKKLLSEIEAPFDWILLDCPPALGNLTDNALNAARRVVIPIQAAASSLRALDLLFDQIESLEKGLGVQIEIVAVVPNMVQDSAMSKQILADLRRSIPHVIPFELRKRVLIDAAWSRGGSVFAYEPRSAAERETRDEVIAMYEQLAQAINDRVRGAVNAGR